MANYFSINKYINRCTTVKMMWMEWKEIAFQNRLLDIKVHYFHNNSSLQQAVMTQYYKTLHYGGFRLKNFYIKFYIFIFSTDSKHIY